MSSFHPLTAVGMSMVREISTNLSATTMNYLETVLCSFIHGRISQKDASSIFNQMIGSPSPITRIAQVLSVPQTPLSEHVSSDHDAMPSGKKIRPWTAIEDMRLLAGINKHGLEAWGTVAQFVGNSRTKAQCAQRWSRGLDPRIAKAHWSREEDQMLMLSVEKHGVKCWTLVARDIPSRSDVQCRYRYNQLTSLVPARTARKTFFNTQQIIPVAQFQPVAVTAIPVAVPIPLQYTTKEKVILPPICSFNL